jgi:TonB family protein
MSQEKVAEIIDLNASRGTAEAGSEESAGDFLANARRAAGLELAAISEEIKIKPDHLAAIEAGDAARLPPIPYAVGFVKVYARFLGLDADALARQFKKDIGAGEIAPAANAARERIAQTPQIQPTTQIASLFGVLAIVFFMIWVGFQVAGNADRPEDEENAAVAGGVVLREASAPPPQPRNVGRDAAAPGPVVIREAAPLIAPETQNAPAPGGLAAADVPAADPVDEPIAPAPDEALPAGATSGSADPGDETIAPAPEDASGAVDETVAIPAEPSAPPGADQAARTEDAAPPAAAPPAREGAQTMTRLEAQPTPRIVEARLIRSVAPEYPVRCDRSAADLEKVSVLFDITATGRTANARVVSSTNACFDASALAALGRWRFDPKTVDGAARPDLGKRATLNFRR